MTTDTSERGLERLICTALTGSPCDAALAQTGPERDAAAAADGVGWICGAPNDYDREYTVDLAQLLAFLVDTQPEAFEGAPPGRTLAQRAGSSWPASRARFANAVSSTCSAQGSRTGPITSHSSTARRRPGNPVAAARYAQNRFSVTRQLRYSRDETQRALDLGLFINGLPIATFELKNRLTKQTVEDAVEQYARDP